MRGMGCAIGEYVGDGQGELESTPQELTSADLDPVDVDPEVDDQSLDEEEDSSEDAHPLLIFYDCETTGFSIYSDHITDIAAKVVASPVPLSTPTFSSLVKTSRRIPAAGTMMTNNIHYSYDNIISKLLRSLASPPQCSDLKGLFLLCSLNFWTG